MDTDNFIPLIAYLRRVTELESGRIRADSELLDLFVLHRDEAAFETIVRRHGPMVLGVCRRLLRNYHDAEDAFQATFVVLARRASSIKPRSMLGNWLYGVAHRTALEARRRRRRQRTQESAMNDLPQPPCQTPEIDDESMVALHNELRRLPNHYRSVIVLCDLEGRTQNEVAQQLSCPIGTVGSRLKRSRALLAKRLARRGFEISSGIAALVLSNEQAGAVPVELLSLAIQAPSRIASTVLAPNVLAITEGVLRNMLLTKLKMATLVSVFLLAAISLGMCFYPDRSHAATNPMPGDEARRSGESHLQKQPNTGMWKSHAILRGHKDDVCCVAFGVDQMATAGKDGAVILWNTTTNKEVRRVVYPAADGLMRRMDFTADGKHILMAYGKYVAFWDTSTNSFPRGGLGGVQAIDIAAIGRNGHTLVLCGDPNQGASPEHASIMEVSRFGRVGKSNLGFGPYKHLGPYRAGPKIQVAALSVDGVLLATAHSDRTVTLWDAIAEKIRFAGKGHKSDITALAVAPNCELLASADRRGEIGVWQIKTGKKSASLKGHRGVIHSIKFDPNSNVIVSGGEDKTVCVWDVNSGKRLAQLRDHRGEVLDVAFSRDGNIIASASKDSSVRLWTRAR